LQFRLGGNIAPLVGKIGIDGLRSSGGIEPSSLAVLNATADKKTP
jgi:hypothetical protein